MKKKLITLIIALMLILSACEFPPPDPSTGSEQDPAPEVSEPTETEDEPEVVETDEPEEEAPALSEVEVCVELLEPLNNTDFPGNARVTFSWSEHPDADSYLLNFIFPDGLELFFAIDETTTARYMSGFSMHPAYNQSGEHQWYVSALNADGEELCQSDLFTFTKAISEIAPESAPQGDGNDGDDGDDACSGPGCGGNSGNH